MKECIILAGGFGTRLKSVVKDVPKCMAEVAHKPFLEYLFQYLSSQKISHIILSLGYKSEVVIDWIKQKTYPFNISYVIEDNPLGTGGAIQFAMTKATTESVLVINGDTFFDVDTNSFFEFHSQKKADISLALKPMNDFDRYGSVSLDENNEIIRFNEKKYCQSGLINGGIYIINKNVFIKAKQAEKFSFEKDILENNDLKLNIFGFKNDAYFIDIGIPSDFEKANIDFIRQ